MTTITDALNLGNLKHELTFEAPTYAPDGDGGETVTWTAFSGPKPYGSVQASTQKALERLVSNTVLSQSSHIVTMRYHPDVTTKCRLKWTDRVGVVHTASLTNVNNVDEMGIQLILGCIEIVP